MGVGTKPPIYKGGGFLERVYSRGPAALLGGLHPHTPSLLFIIIITNLAA